MDKQFFRMTANSIHVRKSPTLSSEVTGILKRDDLVYLTGISDDKCWYQIFYPKGVFGWISKKFAVKSEFNCHVTKDMYKTFPWLSAAIAELWDCSDTKTHNRSLLAKFLSSTSSGEVLNTDVQDYGSAAFVNWCLEQSGYEGTDSSHASSWSYWGREVGKPCPGCIALIKDSKADNKFNICKKVGVLFSLSDTIVEIITIDDSGLVVMDKLDLNRVLCFKLPLSYEFY
ncbi:MAG: SH3 domain-containing C40 family peptidase [Candidatus Kapaibacterium sp.]